MMVRSTCPTLQKLASLGFKAAIQTFHFATITYCSDLSTPKGPRGEKRRADAIGLAVLIGKIATGEVEDERDEKLFPR